PTRLGVRDRAPPRDLLRRRPTSDPVISRGAGFQPAEALAGWNPAHSREPRMNRTALSLLAFLLLAGSAAAQRKDAPPKVTAPPDAVVEKYHAADKEVARKFYKKYLDCKGVAILAASEVADEALLRTHHIVTRMLAGRADVLEVMA